MMSPRPPANTTAACCTTRRPWWRSNRAIAFLLVVISVYQFSTYYLWYSFEHRNNRTTNDDDLIFVPSSFDKTNKKKHRSAGKVKSTTVRHPVVSFGEFHMGANYHPSIVFEENAQETPPSTTTVDSVSSAVSSMSSEFQLDPAYHPDIVLLPSEGITSNTTSTTSTKEMSNATNQHDSTNNNNNPQNNSKNKTLALLAAPFGLKGGYRNQVLRLLALVVHASLEGIDQLLLPSIHWSTTVTIPRKSKREQPIPFDMLFDVDHWNSFATHLPTLVSANAITNNNDSGDCWHAPTLLAQNTVTMEQLQRETTQPKWSRALLQRGYLTPLENLTKAMALSADGLGSAEAEQLLVETLSTNTSQNHSNPANDPALLASLFRTSVSSSAFRRVDLFPVVQHCTNPIVYGGGTWAGRLWQDYTGYRGSWKWNFTIPQRLDQFVLQALRPNRHWRDVAMQCVETNTRPQHKDSTINNNNDNSDNKDESHVPYAALHARVELDMVDHKCGSEMERNLTKIFDMTRDWLNDKHNVSGVFLAVSRDGVSGTGQASLYHKYQTWADENTNALNRVAKSLEMPESGSGIAVPGGAVPVFECGEPWMERYYREHPSSLPFGSLLPSILNFYIAVEASVFVGVRHSSFSTDVWTTRYYQGKGASNFEYTKDRGIIPVENGGLAPPHATCKKQTSDQPTEP